MGRRRWFFHLIARSLAWRRGRAVLLVAVLAMASSLVTSLGIVSGSMGVRVAEELRKYGANLVVLPQTARLDVGSGGLRFGIVAEPAYLPQEEVTQAVGADRREVADFSLFLRGSLKRGGRQVPVEGVDFAAVRRLSPWWQLNGRWPEEGEAVIGSDLARQLSLAAGDRVVLTGAAGDVSLRLAAVVTTGGEEDHLLFADLPVIQRALVLAGRVSGANLVAVTGGRPLSGIAAGLQRAIPGATVREVREVARTSESLLHKVQLLMALVTVVVLVASGSSVASTMGTTVLERGEEIGLMKAMGGRRRDVALLFSAEALCFGLLGGGGGFLVGSAIATIVMRSVFSAPAGILPIFLPVAVGVSLLLALVGSIGPLVAVFRLDPVQSLRGE